MSWMLTCTRRQKSWPGLDTRPSRSHRGGEEIVSLASLSREEPILYILVLNTLTFLCYKVCCRLSHDCLYNPVVILYIVLIRILYIQWIVLIHIYESCSIIDAELLPLLQD